MTPSSVQTAGPHVATGSAPALPFHKVHFIGIGGAGMSGLAHVLADMGCEVSGSDIVRSKATDALAEYGLTISFTQDGSSLPRDADIVVASAAIRDDNPEFVAAKRAGLKIVRYAEVVGRLMAEKRGIAVSGTHGKTTTTAMIATILDAAGRSPSFVIGGDVPALGGSATAGEGEFFVVEACEYNRSFLHLKPEVAVITNIEEEHLDYFANLADILAAFRQFAAQVPAHGLLVVNATDTNIRAALEGLRTRVTTYCINDIEAAWTAHGLAFEGGRPRFRVFRGREDVGEIALKIPGRHNVLNALAAMAVASHVGVSVDDARSALSRFTGASRRFEIVADVKGVTIVDDYGHHPTEIRATLRAARLYFGPRPLWVVFQPHQHSRTRLLLDGFAHAFEDADKVILADIYAQRDSDEDRRAINSGQLAEAIRRTGRDALYLG
ncbi:MAG: UDP-N-acetylmuramate--L-alanine ligase, partial [Planctomycetes bacterium]|nr:UDP-N-acetylmuramate--L-alanine ligase [Planctomycetota bacterium]